VKFTFILDPLDRLDPGHDSTVALMEAAQARGHAVYVTQAASLGVTAGRAFASVRPVRFTPVTLNDAGDKWLAVREWFEYTDAAIVVDLDTMDAVFMRTDPPVNTPYLYATYILDYVDPSQTLVVNCPAGLRQANEKMYGLQFTELMPTTIVSAEKDVIRQFVAEQGRAVLKPIGGMAGEGILFLEDGDRNFNSMIEISTHRSSLPVMVQQFLPAAKDGDKRIILLNGEPIGAVNRIPTGNEFRGNMAVGGRVAKAEITDHEREICRTIAPILQRDGLYFVGLDVIGGYITEINVTSPTGIREIDRLDGVNLGDQTIAWVEAHVPNQHAQNR
jgi:glutathione synthase